MRIRPAQPREHAILSRVARASKAHWGYAEEDLRRWRGELTISAASLERSPTWVAEVDGEIAGFCQLSFAPDKAELEHFWVLPAFMGRGVGKALLAAAVGEVAGRGRSALHIDADPQAEGFYVARGAVRIGEKAAPVVGDPQRVRPQLLLRVTATGG